MLRRFVAACCSHVQLSMNTRRQCRERDLGGKGTRRPLPPYAPSLDKQTTMDKRGIRDTAQEGQTAPLCSVRLPPRNILLVDKKHSQHQTN